jgi:hypothetical protein
MIMESWYYSQRSVGENYVASASPWERQAAASGAIVARQVRANPGVTCSSGAFMPAARLERVQTYGNDIHRLCQHLGANACFHTGVILMAMRGRF